MTWLFRVLSLGLWKPKPTVLVTAIVEGRYVPTVGITPGGFGDFHTFAATRHDANRIKKQLSKTKGINNVYVGALSEPYYLVNGKVHAAYDLMFCEGCGLLSSVGRSWYWSDNDTKLCRKCDEPVESASDLPSKEVIKRVQKHEKSRVA